MVKRCDKCLNDAKYTSENCEFDQKDNKCKAAGMAMNAVTDNDPANCPAKGANKRRPGGSPTTLPEMCGGDGCCVRGKAKGAAILLSAKGVRPKLYLRVAANEFECAAMCTDDCEWWTYDKKKRMPDFPNGACVLYKTSSNGNKTAGAPTGAKNASSKRYISGDNECKPTKEMPSGDDDEF